jgi:hypothetical protein
MVFVPVGYAFGNIQFTTQEVKGNSLYDLGTISGGEYEKNPTKIE